MYECQYPNLFKPLKLGNTILRNRIFAAPTGYCDLTVENIATEPLMAYYESKARGGCAVVHVGEAYIDSVHGVDIPKYLKLDSDDCVSHLATVADAINKHGAIASMPTSNGIIAENYAEDERGKLMGIQDLFTNGGGMYLTLIGGVLAAKAWNYTYLAFLYALIPLVLGCIYFPADKPAKASGEKSHLKIAPITWLFGAIIFVFINSYGVMGANISFIITERGMGTAALTGTAMAIFLVGGMFGGLIFNPFEKKLREYVLCCGFIALVIGFLIIYFAQSLVILFIGAFVVGTSIGFEMPGTLLYATNYNTVEASTAGCAVIHMAGQLGTVCSALFYTPVAGLIKPNDTSFRFLFAACVCTALALLIALAVSITKKKRAA